MAINASRLKAVGPWLAEARYAFYSTTVICISLIISLRPQTTEQVIRLTGLVLQLGGIGTVIWGISETRALFGHPSFASKTKDYLRRFPLLHRRVVEEVCCERVSVTFFNPSTYGIHSAKENPSVESLAESLQKNVTLIHERISDVQDEMGKVLQKAAKDLESEAHSRQAEDNITREKLEATGTGGVHISAIGASWLFVGVILSTAALEIATLLK